MQADLSLSSATEALKTVFCIMVLLFSRFGDTYTIMLHVCGPLARTGKIYELVQAYFPGASIRVRLC